MSENNTILLDAWRRLPPLHLVRHDGDIYADVRQEALRHGHTVEEWHVATWDNGASRYATCTRCLRSVWRIGGRITSLEPALLLPCRGAPLPDRVEAQHTMTPQQESMS